MAETKQAEVKVPELTAGQKAARAPKAEVKVEPKRAVPMLHITPAVTAVRKEYTSAQKKHSHFSEVPRIGATTLRRGQVLKLTERQAEKHRVRLETLFDAHAIDIKFVDADGETRVMKHKPHRHFPSFHNATPAPKPADPVDPPKEGGRKAKKAAEAAAKAQAEADAKAAAEAAAKKAADEQAAAEAAAAQKAADDKAAADAAAAQAALQATVTPNAPAATTEPVTPPAAPPPGKE
jgi:hypothetical protein